jgi:endonuclease/exonuclease/phosphatase family metal-dependent hydrolase
MNKLAKYTFLTLLALFFFIVGFYMWASSPNLSPDEYAKVYAAARPDIPDASNEFSILTYNIGYLSGMTNNRPIEKPRTLFDDNLKTVLANLRLVDADFLAFQEIDYDADRSYNADQHVKIEELGYSFSAKTVNWDKRYVPFPYYPFTMHFGKVISGQSVLSKFPILEHERIELKRNQSNPFYYDSFYLDRLAQVVKVRVEGHDLVLINVHLEAFDQKTRIKQFEQIRSIYAKYCNRMPTILLGDFNSDTRYENAGIRLLTEMMSTGNAAFDPENIENTFDSRDPRERLDYIFYNTDFIEEVDAEIPKGFNEASDHLPVLLTFKFNRNNYGTTNQQPNARP